MVKPQTIFTGDNLPIMRGMNSETVDLIYLDPPFNSKANYAAPIGSQAAGAEFKDTWTLQDIDVAWHGELAEKHQGLHDALLAVPEVHGKSMFSYLIYMAVRLMEMHRILKDTGSIYLHCDTTASHYLKLIMDAIFGHSNYQNEITWKRTSAHNDPNRFGRIADTILFYSKSKDYNFNTVHTPYTDKYIADNFTKKDERGTYRSVDLTGPGTTAGDSGAEWRGYSPTTRGRCWSVPRRAVNLLVGEEVAAKMSVIERLELLYENNYIIFSKHGVPRFKQYLLDIEGVPAQDMWTDIPPISAHAKERTGYPTQKPLALLERIVRASSNADEIVFDPFCGCATACIASEKLGRGWIGIDVSSKAAELVKLRAEKELTDLFTQDSRVFEVIHRTDVPQRTDIDKPARYNIATNKATLYGEQEGNCAGCKIHFPYRNLTIDHIVPKSKGGGDHIENLQLLCGACNSTKGNRPMEYLLAELKKRDVG